GIENDAKNPPEFTGYAMGVVNGVPVNPDLVTGSVYIQMSKTLDSALTMSLTPPAPGPKGPDRLNTTVAVTLGAFGYAILPARPKPAVPAGPGHALVRRRPLARRRPRGLVVRLHRRRRHGPERERPLVGHRAEALQQHRPAAPDRRLRRRARADHAGRG